MAVARAAVIGKSAWQNSSRSPSCSATPSGSAPDLPRRHPAGLDRAARRRPERLGRPGRRGHRPGPVRRQGRHQRHRPRHPPVRLGPRRPPPALPAGHRRRRELAAARHRPGDDGAPGPHPVRGRADRAGRAGTRVPDPAPGRPQQGQPAAARRLPAGPDHRRADQGSHQPWLHRLAGRRLADGAGGLRAAPGRVNLGDGARQRRRRLAGTAGRPGRGRAQHGRDHLQRRRLGDPARRPRRARRPRSWSGSTSRPAPPRCSPPTRSPTSAA